MKIKTRAKTASAVLFSESIPHHLVAEHAYAIWLARGRPEGRDYEHWVEAERQLLAQRPEVESESIAVRMNYWGDPFATDIERALDSIAPTSAPRSPTSL